MAQGVPVHLIIPRDLKRWLESRARREGPEFTLSRYVRQVLQDHRTAVESVTDKMSVVDSPSAVNPQPTERKDHPNGESC
jgi:hypothetical protein